MKYQDEPQRMAPDLKIDGDSSMDYEFKTSSDIDKAIEFVKFNQGMEGFDMSPEDEEECRKILNGEITAQESIKTLLKKNGLDNKKES